MSPALDLICLAVSLVLMALGGWLAYLGVRGDRWRRRRVSPLRCPGRWGRVAIVPWRFGCWYDMATIAPDASGRRRCPECGKASRARALRRSKRSWMRAAVGLVLLGLGSALGFGRDLVRGGLVSAPTWTLALVPFDENDWLHGPVTGQGTLGQSAAAELLYRDQTGRIGGLPGEVLAWRVESRARRAVEHYDQYEDAGLVRRLERMRIHMEIPATSLSDAAQRLAAAAGVTVRIAPDVLYEDDVAPGPDPLMMQMRQNFGQPVMVQTHPEGGVSLGPIAGRPTSLPGIEMSMDKALDLLCERAGGRALEWRATRDGVVISRVSTETMWRLFDARAFAVGGGIARVMAPSMATVDSYARSAAEMARAARFQAAGATPFGFPGAGSFPGQQADIIEEFGTGAWRRLRARVAALHLAWPALTGVAYQPWTNSGAATSNVGDYLAIRDGAPALRRVGQLWGAIDGSAAHPPANRREILEAVARLDMPASFPHERVGDMPGLLSAVEELTGLRAAADPSVVGADVLRIGLAPRGGGRVGWSNSDAHVWIASPGAALLTDHRTASQLRRPRAYRIQMPQHLLEVDAKGIHRATQLLAMLLTRACGASQPVWMVARTSGRLDFVASTREDEHACLSWLLEQSEAALAPGGRSELSADGGWPMRVYNIGDLMGGPHKPVGTQSMRRSLPELASLLGAPEGVTDTRSLHRRARFHQSGPLLIVRGPVEDHERIWRAIEAVRERMRQQPEAAGVLSTDVQAADGTGGTGEDAAPEGPSSEPGQPAAPGPGGR